MNLTELERVVSAVPDPEIPVITLGDLGIVRSVSLLGDVPVIRLTPTYSGCPATEVIRDDVLAAARNAGYGDARVEIELAPAWSTSWISDAGREKLRAYGIAPPLDDDTRAAAGPQTQPVRWHHKSVLTCPLCASADVEELSRYGSTPCKSLYRCRTCREPFDYFKPY